MTGRKPSVAGSQRRMAGERELRNRGEDPYPVVGTGCCRRQDEGRFGKVRPVREALHLPGAQPLGIQDDGDRIAVVGRGGEDIDLTKRAAHVCSVHCAAGRTELCAQLGSSQDESVRCAHDEGFRPA